ncbi:flagellar hook-associated protein FlgL [Desulfovibrio gilichinskyi]|uniref:Flagellar hook-associated protein 3 FlgL n=1 Tax=Desulfovibrio gilichinskyi TaxID=1519643 RepID=A0A1X7CF39_9BACT|nr:flagellar hook-associated protein FlgL [Desulfovibrio gilichinskyi]SME95340.1 flagellar hook-associated protein 3 FlgL [Desulfovibrio gilichinskyi]
MRISTTQIYAQSLTNVNSSLVRLDELNSQNSSQKRINAPSDDAAGMGNVMELRTYDQTLATQVENATVVKGLLGSADDLLSQASEIMTSILEQAEQASTGTYDLEQNQMMAEQMRGYLDSLVSIANSKSGNDYLFSGEATDTSPYEYTTDVTLLGDSPARSDIAEITGEFDKTTLVEFTTDGTIGVDSIDYRFSTDGGESWDTGTLDATAVPPETTLNLGTISVEMNSGVAVTAADEDEGSQFIVRSALSYNGSEKATSVAISEKTEVNANTVGHKAFGGLNSQTDDPYDDPNLFETISDAIAYMEIGDESGVANCLEKLRAGNEALTTVSAEIGSSEEKTSFVMSSITLSRNRIATAISSEEDINAAQLSIELTQANYVYQAVLKSAASIMNTSIMDYL